MLKINTEINRFLVICVVPFQTGGMFLNLDNLNSFISLYNPQLFIAWCGFGDYRNLLNSLSICVFFRAFVLTVGTVGCK